MPSKTEKISNCTADGIPLKTHLRCDGCSILVGPGHQFDSGSLRTVAISGEKKKLCPLCYQDCLDVSYQSWWEFYYGRKG